MPRVEFVGAGGARDFSRGEKVSGNYQAGDVSQFAPLVCDALDGRRCGHAVYPGIVGTREY